MAPPSYAELNQIDLHRDGALCNENKETTHLKTRERLFIINMQIQ